MKLLLNNKSIIEIRNSKKINLYMCGPTSYKNVHLGNMRSMLYFDLLATAIKRYAKIKYVTNITDLDMKIIKQGQYNLESYIKYISFLRNKILNLYRNFEMLKPYKIPGILIPENIFDGLKAYISKLEGVIVKEDGIYWKNFYIWRNLEGDNSIKFHHHHDGIPGWHITCSYFIDKYFGKNGVDIHGGGADLKAHHRAEELLHQCVHSQNIAQKWFYIELLTDKEGKISKTRSSANIDLYLKNFSYGALKYYTYKNNYYSKTIFNIIDLLNSNSDFNTLCWYIYQNGYNNHRYSMTIDTYLYKYLLSNSHYLLTNLISIINSNTNNLFKHKLCSRIITLFNFGKLINKHIKSNISKYRVLERLIKIREYYKNNKSYTISDRIREGLYKKFRNKYYNFVIIDIKNNNTKLKFLHENDKNIK